MATICPNDVLSISVVPRGKRSAAEQLDALRRAQAQTDLRTKIGVQLVKAAEAHATQQQSILSQVKAHQETLHQQMKAEVEASLVHYDHQINRIDDDFTQRLQGLEDRIDGLARQWEQSRRKIDLLLDRAENLLDEPEVRADDENHIGETGGSAGQTDVVASDEIAVAGSQEPPLPIATASIDPHAGATVAPPTVIDPRFEAPSTSDGGAGAGAQNPSEPVVRFSEMLEKLDFDRPA